MPRTISKSIIGRLVIATALATSISITPSLQPYAYAQTKQTKANYKKFFKYARKNDITKAQGYIVKHPNLDVNYADKHGQTAIYIASAYGSEQVFYFLLQKGADVNVPTKDGDTALMHVVSTQWKNTGASRSGMATALLSAGADANAQKKVGDKNTALNIAIIKERSEMVALLLQHKADPNFKNGKNKSPVMIAASQITSPIKYDIISLLAEHGADMKVLSPEGFNLRDVARFNLSENMAPEQESMFARYGITILQHLKKSLNTAKQHANKKKLRGLLYVTPMRHFLVRQRSIKI